MKKWIISISILVVAVIGLFCLVSCKKEPEKLPTPQNIHIEGYTFINYITKTRESEFIDDKKVVWDPVENAQGYVVVLDGKEYETTECFLETPEYFNDALRIGDTVEVMALGDWEYFEDSKWGTIHYDFLKDHEQANQMGYFFVDGGFKIESASTANGSLNIESMTGRLVYPDFVMGQPVLEVEGPSYMYAGVTGWWKNDVTTEVRLPYYAEKVRGFINCVKLEKVTFPMANVEIKSFRDCVNLKEISFANGANVTINGSAFEGCVNLSKMDFSNVTLNISGGSALDDTAWYASQPNGYVMIQENHLYKYKGDMPAGTVLRELPEDAEIIAPGAFSGCKGLTKVYIGEDWNLADYMFSACLDLTEVYFPKSMKQVPDYMFIGCTKLEKVELSEDLERAVSFYNCIALKELVVPVSVTFIGRNYIPETCSVFYKGTAVQWAEIIISGQVKSPIYFYTEEAPKEGGNYWHYAEDGKTPIIW